MQHIDEILALMRQRQTTDGDLLYPDCAITDVAFGQRLVSAYRTLLKNVVASGAVKGPKRKRLAPVQLDCIPDDFQFDDRIM